MQLIAKPLTAAAIYFENALAPKRSFIHFAIFFRSLYARHYYAISAHSHRCYAALPLLFHDFQDAFSRSLRRRHAAYFLGTGVDATLPRAYRARLLMTHMSRLMRTMARRPASFTYIIEPAHDIRISNTSLRPGVAERPVISRHGHLFQ